MWSQPQGNQPNSVKPAILWSGGPFRTKCTIGLGRDGILNECLEDDQYCFRIDDFKAIPGSMEAMAELRLKGYKVVILTEQGGIAKGLFKQADVEAVHVHMFELLGKAGCQSIDALYFSESDNKQDMYAKPNTGMFKRAEKEIPGIKFKEGYYVGNTIRDLKAAVNAGAKPVLVRTGRGLATEKDLNKWTYRELKRKTLVFDNLAAFVSSLA